MSIRLSSRSRLNWATGSRTSRLFSHENAETYGCSQERQDQRDALGTGRRKSRLARVRIRPGSGQILINKRPIEDYFAIEQDRRQLTDTLEMAGCAKNVDVVITVRGGGTTGQAGACKMASPGHWSVTTWPASRRSRDAGALTRDSRMKERKKYGLHGARKARSSQR